MNLEALFAGAGGVVLGSLLTVWLQSKLTHEFQQKLLDQQLAAQDRSQNEFLGFLNKAGLSFDQRLQYMQKILDRMADIIHSKP